MIEAKIVADSISSAGVRLTTFVLTYPRFIHAEFMTHRVFSRNASSSRAIPVEKQIQEVIDNPAIPLEFRKNKKGMQAGELLPDQNAAIGVWLQARDFAVGQAKLLVAMEVHKQYANRILEPYAHITVVCTATDFDNFFALRCHEAAQPEIHALADKMYGLYVQNKPELVRDGDWHLPFMDKDSKLGEEYFDTSIDVAIKRSVARCARVSYKNHDGSETTVQQDLDLYKRLLGQIPIHASPAEHQAMAIPQGNIQSGNFRGWLQFRKTIPYENILKYNPIEE